MKDIKSKLIGNGIYICFIVNSILVRLNNYKECYIQIKTTAQENRHIMDSVVKRKIIGKSNRSAS